MKHAILLLTILLPLRLAAENWLVEDGQPHAEIVIAENPARSIRLAADELQRGIEKISGARLPIVYAPTPGAPVQIYVGRSLGTDRLGISADGLDAGAYRIVSGENWLVLIGDDTDFTPIEPWPKRSGGIMLPTYTEPWDKVTGGHFGSPLGQMRKHRLSLPGNLGLPEGEGNPSERFDLWGFDERGSFNAVCDFLRKLGMRWYLPGELGEIVPKLDSIPLPDIDETVRPDFPVRKFNVRFSVHGEETARWMMRLGVRDPFGVDLTHGMDAMTKRRELKLAHPDWFALVDGERDNDPDKGNQNHLCYSNDELFQATVQYTRAVFDHYGFETVSLMPPDGYVNICECSLCEGKATPERDYPGRLSDHVWDFVNRVAKEVGRTHPDRFVSCSAYSTFKLPPLKIDKLEPNVEVCIVGGRRPRANLPEEREEIRRLLESWRAKTDRPFYVFENYPFTARGWYLPAFTARSIGETVNATKGISQGEDIWINFSRDFHKDPSLGFNHFGVYFTARMYWGGPGADVDALLAEYCERFYGPAGDEMRTFFDYCEENWRFMSKERDKIDAALGLFAKARAAAPPDSVYARRIALIDTFLDQLRLRADQLGKVRGPVPMLRVFRSPQPGEIVIDGKLDDKYWNRTPVGSGSLRETETGRAPALATTFKSAYSRDLNSAIFAIRCEERPGEPLNIATTGRDDPAIFEGDAVELLIETESHSYYQIAVNPAGAVFDADCAGATKALDWDARAEVATHVADDHWTVEIRIPVTSDDNDPLHLVVGRGRPKSTMPWFFNLGRHRVRDNGAELSAFSPTATGSLHEVSKFAHYFKGDHDLSYGDTEPDYLRLRSRARQLFKRDREGAVAALEELAASDGLTARQRCDALALAAFYARRFRDFDRAERLAAAAPIEAVAKTIRMQNLIEQRQFGKIIEQFGEEDLSRWPFWVAAEGYFARGRARAELGDNAKAGTDLQMALSLTTDKDLRREILEVQDPSGKTSK